ncbi:MAG: T9SS type A sorting domain-containing protein [Bacteroidetes bacterium]|nr:T9SS type A sorting domain-containing protein [Bacteroidota bacterium]
MKKIYILICLLGLAAPVFAQTYLSENFSSGQMPPAGWTIENQQAQWGISNSSSAGGLPPEAKFTYVNTTTTTRLISPEINLTGLTTVTFMFNYMYDWYANPAPVMRVATRHGGGAWTTAWEITPTGNMGPVTIILNISNSDVGSSTFQFCFYLNGNLYNLDYVYLDDIILFTPYPTDAALTGIKLPAYVVVGDSATLTGTVKNLGANTITSFDVSYTVDGGLPVVCSLSGLNLALGNSYDFTHVTKIHFDNPGSSLIDVKISNVNGGIDNNPANDTASTHVGAVPWLPEKKVFCEEATGTWCGWCVRGICYMNYMDETYPDTWIGVAVHNGDPMVDAPYDAEIPNIIPNFPGYPSGTIDRVGDYWDPQDFEQGYLQEIASISPGSVGIVNFTWNPATRDVSFDVQANFCIDVYNELRLCAVIVEDSVWGTTSGYNQANYYAGGSNGPMCGFESLTSTIPAAQMHYDHVARAILDTPYGTAGSIPTPALAGPFYTHTYTYNIPTNWVFEKLKFVSLLLDHTTGGILNANNIAFWVGINDDNNVNNLRIYPNPTSDFTNVVFTIDKQSMVGLKVHNLLGNTVYSTGQKSCPAGENKILLPLASLDNGLYIVEVTIGNRSFTEKVSVNK